MSTDAIQNPIRVLLIEDDEDDFLIVKEFMSQVPSKYELEWVSSCDAGLLALSSREHDICLLDYRVGGRNGLDVLRESLDNGFQTPIIILTGQGDYDIDLEAMQLGAADYLIKDQINSAFLERSIRYSLDRKRTNEVIQNHEKQLRFLTSKLLSAQEEERGRLARDIHDIIGSSLSAVKFKVEEVLHDIKEIAPAIVEPLETIIPILKESISECRRIQSDLRPPGLDDLGLLASLSWFSRRVQSIYSTIRIEQEIGLTEDDIPNGLKIVIFRIIQEAMNNMAKHSQADLVSLSLQKKDDCIEMVIRDNGKGFDLGKVLAMESSMKGMGLSSMKERAEFSGGSLDIVSTIGGGTIIRASWSV